MMKPLIPPSYYSNTEIFQREQVIIFQNLWSFAGFTTDLEKHNDYICIEIGGKSVIIQNFYGEFRAFLNVCSHRFSQIHRTPQGNCALKCPYHGWVYNSDGIPTGIPSVEQFDEITDAVRESLRLERWLVETCGTLLFIKRYDDGLTLKEFLNGIYDKLAELSGAFGKKIDERQVELKANWKLATENTLEGYHVFSVHQNTFAKYGVPASKKYSQDGVHSAYSDRVNPEYIKKSNFKANSIVEKRKATFQSKLEPILNTRPLKLEGYHHQFVFPNLTFAIDSGVTFSVQIYQPINSLETRLVNYFFLTKLEINSAFEQGIVDVLSQSSSNTHLAIFEEDKTICETVQAGISSSDKGGGIFSCEEQRVYEFHKAYTNFMDCKIGVS